MTISPLLFFPYCHRHLRKSSVVNVATRMFFCPSSYPFIDHFNRHVSFALVHISVRIFLPFWIVSNDVDVFTSTHVHYCSSHANSPAARGGNLRPTRCFFFNSRRYRHPQLVRQRGLSVLSRDMNVLTALLSSFSSIMCWLIQSLNSVVLWTFLLVRLISRPRNSETSDLFSNRLMGTKQSQ